MSMIVDWLSSHSLLLLLSAGTLFSFLWIMQFRERLAMRWYAALPIAIVHTLVGVVCVKAFAFMETGFNPDSLGNMSLFGGVFFMPLIYLAGAKLTKAQSGGCVRCFYRVHDHHGHVRPCKLYPDRLLRRLAFAGSGNLTLADTGGRAPVLHHSASHVGQTNLEKQNQRNGLPNLHDRLWNLSIHYRVVPLGEQPTWIHPHGAYLGAGFSAAGI